MSATEPPTPEPGSPEFLALVQRSREAIFRETGVWVDAVDIGGTDQGYYPPEAVR